MTEEITQTNSTEPTKEVESTSETLPVTLTNPEIAPDISAAPKQESKKDVKEKIEIWATGRRKTSTTRIKLSSKGTGKISINNKTLDDYFGGHQEHKKKVLQPLNFFNQKNEYDIMVNVSGGGITGQAEAIRLGISRALSKFSPDLRGVLKENFLLRRDPRMVERKKSGQPKARKKFQWTKR